MGFTFFWAFIDKLFGLGFATTADKSWLTGASPTTGFLKFGTHGPFKDFFVSLAGNPLIDWLFMLGLAFIGLSLLLGIAVRLAGIFGAVLVTLMFLSLLPPENNPLMDEHVIYFLVLLLLSARAMKKENSSGSWWSKTSFAKNYPILR